MIREHSGFRIIGGLTCRWNGPAGVSGVHGRPSPLHIPEWLFGQVSPHPQPPHTPQPTNLSHGNGVGRRAGRWECPLGLSGHRHLFHVGQITVPTFSNAFFQQANFSSARFLNTSIVESECQAKKPWVAPSLGEIGEQVVRGLQVLSYSLICPVFLYAKGLWCDRAAQPCILVYGEVERPCWIYLYLSHIPVKYLHRPYLP